jgi:uncharacterized protein YndB with AHSA1/START domain
MTPTPPTPPAGDSDASQAESLSFTFDLPHSPQKVWRALTDPALLSEWLLPVINLKLEPGAAFTFTAPPQPGWDGIVNCRMREIETHRKLSWSWVVGDIDTVVTFTLTPMDGRGDGGGAGGPGTRLALLHSGFKPHQKRNFAGARYGWKMMSGRLIDLLGRIP